MSAYHVVLFLHLVFLVASFAAAGLLHLALLRLHAGGTAPEARQAALLAQRAGRALPLGALGLFATGAYMVADAWSWGDSWVICSIAGLVLMEAIGGAVLGRRGDALLHALEGAEGPLPAAAAARLRDPVLWHASNVPTALAFGVMFVMVTKPGWLGSLVTLVIAVGLGVATGVPLARSEAPLAVAREHA
jgi:hypothetical protein